MKRADTVERVVPRVGSFSTARARFLFLFLSFSLVCVFILFSLSTTRVVFTFLIF